MPMGEFGRFAVVFVLRKGLAATDESNFNDILQQNSAILRKVFQPWPTLLPNLALAADTPIASWFAR